ncbi:MAG: hypothetical protein ACTSWR_11530 [Candidatus Helarchaeota archaeon]
MLYGPITDLPEQILDGTIDSKIGFIPPSGYIPNRLVAEANASIIDFYYLVHQAVQILKPDLMCVPAYPDYLLAGTVIGQEITSVDDPTTYMADTITFKLVRRLPGILSQHRPDAAAAVREKTFHVREIKNPVPGLYLSDLNFIDKTIKVMGRYFDNWVRFEFWSTSNYRVENMLLWFEEMMALCRSTYFQRFGVAEVLFEELNITSPPEGRFISKINYRVADYYVRTERLYLDYDNILKQIKVKFVDKF